MQFSLLNIKFPMTVESSLARLIVTILLAKLHSRSDGADVAGMDKNLCDKTDRAGYIFLLLSHHISGSENSFVPVRNSGRLTDPRYSNISFAQKI